MKDTSVVVSATVADSGRKQPRRMPSPGAGRTAPEAFWTCDRHRHREARVRTLAALTRKLHYINRIGALLHLLQATAQRGSRRETLSIGFSCPARVDFVAATEFGIGV